MSQDNICPECKNDTWSTVINNHIWQCHKCGYIKKENLWGKDPKKWDRTKGSKEEQGIKTPSNPIRKPNSCDCFFVDGKLYQICTNHYFGLQLAEKNQKDMKNNLEKVEEILKEAKEQSTGTPWVENTRTSDEVSVGIITPTDSSES